MPYYNKLYKTELFKYNPLHDVDMTTTNVGQRTGERTDIANSNDSRTNSFNGTRESDNKETNVNTTESTGNRNTEDRDMYSDTPQGSLTGVDTNTYLTNFRKVLGNDARTDKGNATGITSGKQSITDANTENTQGSNTTSSVGKTNNTEDYVMHVVGKSAGANYSKMIKDFRDNLLNIDMMIIKDLAELFMLIW